MSCDREQVRVGTGAGLRAGLGRLSSKAGHVTGRMATALRERAGRSASAALTVTGSFDGPQTVDALLPLAGVSALLAGRNGRNIRLTILNGITTAQVGRAVGRSLGTGLARLSRVKEEEITSRIYFKGRSPVRLFSSRLTPLLNARDVMGVSGTVQFSEGRIFETEGQAWHGGTTVLKTGAGVRTITHLQRLSWPGSHYYFDRPLKEIEVAGIISGQKGFEARHLPGFAGQISELETLAPTLAAFKRNLIRVRLLWGPTDNSK